MYHSITFTNRLLVRKNTWNDWFLIPTAKPVVALPGVTTNLVTIPGRDDPIDLSTYLTGKIVKTPRIGKFEFYVDNTRTGYDPEAIREDILSYLHGEKLKMVLEDEPKYYYEGRFTFDAWTPDAKFSKVTIGYQLNVARKLN